MTTICFDFGNSRLKAAVFKGGDHVENIILQDDSLALIENLVEKFKPEKTILSSVISHNEQLEQFLTARSKFHKVSALTKLNFTLDVSKPATVGTDRIAVCAAAVQIYPSLNILVIALGSCITYNFVNQYAQFLGGAISPGMDMRFKAMQLLTAKLPRVDVDVSESAWNIPLIGYDTKTNMQSGVVFGMAAEIDGIITKYTNRYGNFNVVLTGGNSGYFAGQLKNKIFADSNFLFKGLYVLSELNN